MKSDRLFLLVLFFLFESEEMVYAQATTVGYESDTNFLHFDETCMCWKLKSNLPDGKYIIYRKKYKYLIGRREKRSKNKFAIYLEGQYKNGVKEGLFLTYSRYYSRDNYFIKRIENYTHGKLDGPTFTYFYDKKLEETGYYKRGMRDSIWTRYYESGVIQQNIIYCRDSVTYWNNYYPTARLHSKGFGLGETTQDSVTVYYNSGELSYVAHFIDGKMQYWRFFNLDSTIKEEALGTFGNYRFSLEKLNFFYLCPKPTKGYLNRWVDGIKQVEYY